MVLLDGMPHPPARRRRAGAAVHFLRRPDSRIIAAQNRPTEVESFDPEVLLAVLSDVRPATSPLACRSHWTGIGGKVADRLNDIIGADQALGDELERVSRVIGKKGKLSQRVSFKGTDQVSGRCIESVDSLIEELVRPSNGCSASSARWRTAI